MRGRRGRGLLVAVLVVVGGAAVVAQSEERRQSLKVVDGVVSIRGEDVPVGNRVASVLNKIGVVQQLDLQDGGNRTYWYLRSLAIVDPDSEGARELCEVALAHREFSDSDLEEFQRLLRDLERSGELTEETLADAQNGLQNRLLQSAGEAFGTWLNNRELEGMEINPLVERFLAKATVTIGTTSTEPEFDYEEFAEEVAAFERGLRSRFGRLPRAVRDSVGRGGRR